MPAYADTESKTDKETLLAKAKRCFKLAQAADMKQRELEEDDLRFQFPELQWDDVARRERQGSAAAGVPTPARPMLSISRLDQPHRLVLNQARAARLGVNIHPVSEDANKEGAEIRQGLYRRIERDSNADQARLWALGRASWAGRGAYRVCIKWDEDSDPKHFDQEIVIERILHQNSVYFDPSAVKADFSDGDWTFVTGWMTYDQFKREFPGKELVETGSDIEWQTLQEDFPDWVRLEGEQHEVLIAEYWYKEHKVKEVKGEGQSYDGKKVARTRTVDEVTVYCAKLCGMKVLENEEWDGKLIPIIPVIGVELQPYDGKRRWVGMIRPAKDGQKFYNFCASAFAERIALEPKSPFVGAHGQFEGFEASWQQANTRNQPYLEYNPIVVGDKQVAAPNRVQVDSSGTSLAMQGMQEADRFIQATTSVYDPSLGRENPRDKSGKAIIALQQQSDAGTSHFLSSLADVSMPLEARIVMDLMPHVYDRPGRITTILKGDDDESEHIVLNAPFVKGPDGKVSPVPPGHPQAKEYDLRKGRYSISVDVGKSFQTRLQAGSEAMAQVVQASPEMLMVMGDLLFRFQDFPGSAEVADRMKKFIASQHPNLMETEQGSPEQTQQQLQAMNQQMQQMQQQLQQAGDMIKTDQVKAQASIETAKINASKDIELQKMRDATSIAVAQINAAAKGVLLQTERQNEALATGLQQAHEAEESLKDRAHEVAMAHVQHQQGQEAAATGAVLNEAPPEAPGAPPVPA